MLENLTLKQKIIFFIILAIMIAFIIFYIYTSLSTSEDIFFTSNSSSNLENTNYPNEFMENSEEDIENQNTSSNSIIVYICGCVKENKNVSLSAGSRISDAIDAAGGLSSNADLKSINMAYILSDGEKIYIPEKGEEIENYPNDLNFSSQSTKSNKVNINTATQSELETIPSIGPSTALKIINYRKDSGAFKTIEEIKNVSGIGDSKYNQIKDFISTK